jgi:peptide/nickel transport system substrate-binding protein
VNRHSRALLSILLLAAVAIPYWLYTRAADPPPAASSADPVVFERGGTLVASTRSDPRSFNRLVSSQIGTELFAILMQGRLVRINKATQDLEPWLAESWTTSADGRTFTLTLREGLQWSDGAPFSSADVVFTFQALYDPRTASPLASGLMVAGQPLTVTAPDARTVVVSTAATFGPGIRVLDLVPIMPRHKLEAAFAAGTFAKAWSPGTPPTEMASIGPFVLIEYQPSARLVFARNPHYWRRDERGVQLPYADRLTIEIVPDLDAELVRLQSGQIDFTQQPLRASDIATLRPLELQGRVAIRELGVSLEADGLLFNLRPGKWTSDPRATWLARTEFRQAISHLVDREAFANTVYLGAAVPVHGPVTPGNRRWFWPSVPRYEFAPEKATALLSSIGLAQRDQDPWLEDAAGVDARLTVLTFRGNSLLERGAAVIRDDLARAGIGVDIVPLETNSVQQRVVAGDFEAAFIQLIASDTDPAMSRDFWLSSGSAHFWNPQQPSPATPWEREIDELMARQAAATDHDERRRLFNDVQRLFAENLPILYFAAPRAFVGTSGRLLNLQAAPTRPPILWAVDAIAVRAPAAASP